MLSIFWLRVVSSKEDDIPTMHLKGFVLHLQLAAFKVAKKCNDYTTYATNLDFIFAFVSVIYL